MVACDKGTLVIFIMRHFIYTCEPKTTVSMQRTRRIDDFFRHTDPEKQQRHQAQCNYFYIDWGASEPYQAQWMRERPVPLDFQVDIECTKTLGPGRIITVCCVFPAEPSQAHQAEQDAEPAEPLYRDTTLLALLKSNLQKCMRRQLVVRAKETARYLAELDLQLLVRWLAIIMLEDVVLYPAAFGVLAWLTAALSKNFVGAARRSAGEGVLAAIQEWLLGLVDALCRESREAYWAHRLDQYQPGGGTGSTVVTLWNDAAALPPQQRDSIYSLLFRHSYGGLPGDCAMMMAFATLVQRGTHEAISTSDESSVHRRIRLAQVKRLDLAFVELAAVDFHCLPGMLYALSRFCEQQQERRQLQKKRSDDQQQQGAKLIAVYSTQDIKQAVWHHSSKCNKRVTRVPREERERKDASHACFHTIKWKLEWLQQEHIKSCSNMTALHQYRLAYGTSPRSK